MSARPSSLLSQSSTTSGVFSGMLLRANTVLVIAAGDGATLMPATMAFVRCSRAPFVSWASCVPAADRSQFVAGSARSLDVSASMAENTSETPTVEVSLQLLSDAVGKAADDLCAARVALDRARIDIASRNTSVSRRVVGAAERVVDHLRQTDEALRDVVKELEERD